MTHLDAERKRKTGLTRVSVLLIMYVKLYRLKNSKKMQELYHFYIIHE